MANHPQAQKRNRQRIKRTIHNKHFRTTMRTYIKRVRSAIEAKDLVKAREALKEAVPVLDRCSQKSVIPRQRASRLISRLTLAVTALES